MSWRQKLLGDLCDGGGGFIRTGPFGSQLHQSDYQASGTPMVMPKDIVGGRVSDDTVARVGEEHVHRLEQHRLETGDIVYGRRGDIGRCALITAREKGWLCGTGCLRIHLGSADVEPEFLFYFLNHPETIGWIYNQAVGATMPNLNTGILRSVPVRYPDKIRQRRIASILSAYDNMIGNNTRRIAILEQMARRIYEEWFVHFRAPGCEGQPLVDSPLGPLPLGWEAQTLTAVAGVNPEQIKLKQPPKRISYIDIASVSPGRIEQITSMDFADAPNRARRIVRSGDTIWSCVRPNRRSYAFIQRPGEDWVASTGFAVLRPSAGLTAYVYHAVTTNGFVDYLVGRATGAAYPAVTADTFESAPIIVPPSDTTKAFDIVVAPMMRLANTLRQQCHNLRSQRDLLLPKLISGEIDVSEAEELLDAAE